MRWHDWWLVLAAALFALGCILIARGKRQA